MTHAYALGIVVAVAACGGHSSAEGADAAQTRNMASGDAATDGQVGDEASPTVDIVPLDAGIFAECRSPDGDVAACTVCESFDAYPSPDAECTLEGLQCGVGCTLDCYCHDGQWGCSVPPCR